MATQFYASRMLLKGTHVWCELAHRRERLRSSVERALTKQTYFIRLLKETIEYSIDFSMTKMFDSRQRMIIYPKSLRLSETVSDRDISKKGTEEAQQSQ